MYITLNVLKKKKKIHNDEWWQHRCVSYDKTTVIHENLNILYIFNNNMGQWHKENITTVRGSNVKCQMST